MGRAPLQLLSRALSRLLVPASQAAALLVCKRWHAAGSSAPGFRHQLRLCEEQLLDIAREGHLPALLRFVAARACQLRRCQLAFSPQAYLLAGAILNSLGAGELEALSLTLPIQHPPGAPSTAGTALPFSAGPATPFSAQPTASQVSTVSSKQVFVLGQPQRLQSLRGASSSCVFG